MFLFSPLVFYSFQYADLSNPLLRRFESFRLSFPDKVTRGTYNFVSFVAKITLVELGSSLLLSFADKAK